jgi:mono/diheme cytochrome c family protein
VKLISLMALALVSSLTACSGPGATRAGDHSARQDLHAVEHGARQFRLSCAGCHGADARGNGPIAPVLNVPVPDLTLISARRGMQFPDDETFRIIDGQADLSAHGPRHMPVWGYEFFGDEPDDEMAHRRATGKIERVLDYLRSIQRAP